MKKAQAKAEKLRLELEKEKAKEHQPAFAAALSETRNRFDYILEEYKTSDYVQIIGKIGGDVLTFRVYKDGSVYEK